MASKAFIAVLAAFLALQVSANVVPRGTDLNTIEGMFSTLVDMLNQTYHVVDHGGNFIRDNSKVILAAIHDRISEEVQEVGKIVISDIENLEKVASSETASACLTVEKHKAQGFVDVTIQESTQCTSEHYRGLFDPIDEVILGFDWLLFNATKLEKTFTACEENDTVCKLLVIHDVYELFVNVPRTNLGSGARAFVEAERNISSCISNGIYIMKEELEILYREASSCLKK